MNWLDARHKSNDGLTPLAFFFSHTSRLQPTNTISEKKWQSEADRLGISLHFLKTMTGRNAFVNEQGHIVGCNIHLQQKGLCGGPVFKLPVDQRVSYAKALVERSARCRWIGFDMNYHLQMAYSSGGGDHVLFVKAQCR